MNRGYQISKPPENYLPSSKLKHFSWSCGIQIFGRNLHNLFLSNPRSKPYPLPSICQISNTVPNYFWGLLSSAQKNWGVNWFTPCTCWPLYLGVEHSVHPQMEGWTSYSPLIKEGVGYSHPLYPSHRHSGPDCYQEVMDLDNDLAQNAHGQDIGGVLGVYPLYRGWL